MTTIYTTDQLCELMHRDKRYIKQLRDSGLLMGTKFGHGWLYHECEINGLFERLRGKEVNTYEDMVLLAESHKKRAKR